MGSCDLINMWGKDYAVGGDGVASSDVFADECRELEWNIKNDSRWAKGIARSLKESSEAMARLPDPNLWQRVEGWARYSQEGYEKGARYCEMDACHRWMEGKLEEKVQRLEQNYRRDAEFILIIAANRMGSEGERHLIMMN